MPEGLEFTYDEVVALLAACVFVHAAGEEADTVDGALALSNLASAHDKIAQYLNTNMDEELNSNGN
jgi:hypothetical protein